MMGAPDWWNGVLAELDQAPLDTPLSAVLERVRNVPGWTGTYESAVLHVLVNSTFDTENAVPFPHLEHVFTDWPTWFAELTTRGPSELRARVADALWCAQHRREDAATAIDRYLDAAKVRIADTGAYPSAARYLHRAHALAATLRDNSRRDLTEQLALKIMSSTPAAEGCVSVANLFAEVGGNVSAAAITCLEPMTLGWERGSGPRDWDGLRQTMSRLVAANKKLKRVEQTTAWRERRARTYLAQADALEGADAGAILVADCLSRAVKAVRDVNGDVKDIHLRLLATQARIADDLHHVTGPTINATRESLALSALVGGLPFRDQLRKMCSCIVRPSSSELDQAAAETAQAHPLLSLIQHRKIDREGRRLASPESTFDRLRIDHIGFHRAATMMALEPMRRRIRDEAMPGVSKWVEALHDQALFDPATALTLSSGLEAGLQGQWIAATSILVLHMETLIRRLLKDDLTSTLNADLTQDEKSFSELLKKKRLTDLLGADWVFDLTSLLVEPGSNLRNRVAHGMLTDSDFHSADSHYLWFVVIELLLTVVVSEVQQPSPADDS